MSQSQSPTPSNPPPRDFADHGFKAIFRHRSLLAQLLHASLAPDVFQRLDCQNAIPQETSFGDIGFRKRYADVLWLVPWRDDPHALPVLIAVLIEHQSRPSRIMPIRIYWYLGDVWMRQYRDFRQARSQTPSDDSPLDPDDKLDDEFQPYPALSLVFYTGQETWAAPRTLKELINAPKMLDNDQPDCQPVYWELRRHEAAELQRSESELMKVLSVARAERSEFEVFRRWFFQALDDLDESQGIGVEASQDLKRLVLAWAERKRPRHEWESLANEQASRQAMKKRSKGMIEILPGSMADHYIKEGEQIGEKRGEQRGEKRGRDQERLETSKTILRELMIQKFGDLAPKIVRRINVCKDAQLIQAEILRLGQMTSPDDLHLKKTAKPKTTPKSNDTPE